MDHGPGCVGSRKGKDRLNLSPGGIGKDRKGWPDGGWETGEEVGSGERE